MNITTERLILTEINRKDLQNIHALHSIPEVDEYNTLGIPTGLSETKKLMTPDIEDQEKEIRSRYCWKVQRITDSTFIGLAGMFLSNDKYRMAEFYYKLNPHYWGDGLGTEIAKGIIRFGFETHHLHRIEAGVATKNTASIRVLEKAGMKCEGLRRKILPIRGEWKDNYHFAILDEDFTTAIKT